MSGGLIVGAGQLPAVLPVAGAPATDAQDSTGADLFTALLAEGLPGPATPTTTPTTAPTTVPPRLRVADIAPELTGLGRAKASAEVDHELSAHPAKSAKHTQAEDDKAADHAADLLPTAPATALPVPIPTHLRALVVEPTSITPAPIPSGEMTMPNDTSPAPGAPDPSAVSRTPAPVESPIAMPISPTAPTEPRAEPRPTPTATPTSMPTAAPGRTANAVATAAAATTASAARPASAATTASPAAAVFPPHHAIDPPSDAPPVTTDLRPFLPRRKETVDISHTAPSLRPRPSIADLPSHPTPAPGDGFVVPHRLVSMRQVTHVEPKPVPTLPFSTGSVSGSQPLISRSDRPEFTLSARPQLPPAPQPALSGALTRLVHRGDGEHVLTVALHPAELGAVNVTAVVRGGQLAVSVACADPAAHAAVTAAMPSLQQDLNLAGFAAIDVSVSADGRSSDHEGAPQRSQSGHSTNDDLSPLAPTSGPRRPPGRRTALDQWL